MWFNPIVKWLLKSPLHFLVSKGLVLVTVSGHKSGKPISTPANYLREGDTLWVLSWRDRTWWRNLRGGSRLTVRLAGKNLPAEGLVVEEAGKVADSLQHFFSLRPANARYVGIGMDAEGKPRREDCLKVAEKAVMVRIDLGA